ncbi:MAG: riboflavin synthase subunit alpha [Zetaproteobacteria bacterium CG2_30_46_52]|nr:MAG: riboflavin synthase subunit alpha [Zetaproteobacteria bacterium CG2_30_46_52]
MFTGIILDVGKIAAIDAQEHQALLVFSTVLDMANWQLGDSVAVDGCCLTITAFPEGKKSKFSATLSPETLSLTRFLSLNVGSRVNLEPALRMGDALGGHLVTGHIDAMAKVTQVRALGEHHQIHFEVPNNIKQYIVKKGSVTLNGVSLTVNSVEDKQFAVNLIPHTLAHTNLSDLRVGSMVNIETDLMGRYVERLLECRNEQQSKENT